MKSLPRTSKGLIALVIVLVIVLLAALLVNLPIFDGLLGRNQLSTPTGEANLSIPSMTTGPSYFATRFNENDEYAARFPVGIVGQFTRELTPDGFYHLTNQQEQSAVAAIANTPTVYNNVIITMEAALQDRQPSSKRLRHHFPLSRRKQLQRFRNRWHGSLQHMGVNCWYMARAARRDRQLDRR